LNGTVRLKRNNQSSTHTQFQPLVPNNRALSTVLSSGNSYTYHPELRRWHEARPILQSKSPLSYSCTRLRGFKKGLTDIWTIVLSRS
jgi:hypothetical protein